MKMEEQKKEYTPKTNTGNLFTASEKQKCDYSGSFNLDGTILDISGWKKEGKKGLFINLAVWSKDVPFEERKLEKIDQDVKGYQMRNNTGIMFISKDEDESDFYGSIKLDNIEVKINAKMKQGAKGAYLSLTKSFYIGKAQRTELKNSFLKNETVESGKEVI